MQIEGAKKGSKLCTQMAKQEKWHYHLDTYFLLKASSFLFKKQNTLCFSLLFFELWKTERNWNSQNMHWLVLLVTWQKSVSFGKAVSYSEIDLFIVNCEFLDWQKYVKMSHCAMISVPKVLDIKWHESSYNNKGVKKASRKNQK